MKARTATAENGVLMHIPIIGPYNTEHLVTFVDTLYSSISSLNKRGGRMEITCQSTCQFPSIQYHHSMVCDPQQDANGVPLTLLPTPYPH